MAVEGRGYLRVLGWLGLLFVFGCKSHPVPVTAMEANKASVVARPMQASSDSPLPSQSSRPFSDIGALASDRKGRAEIGVATISGGDIPNAERVLAAMRYSFRVCFNKALVAAISSQDNSAKVVAAVELVATVDPNGNVTAVQERHDTDLPDVMIGCILRRVRSQTFSGSGGASKRITIPITFVEE